MGSQNQLAGFHVFFENDVIGGVSTSAEIIGTSIAAVKQFTR